MTHPVQLPADSRLSGLTLRVRDRSTQTAFYHETLGLEVLEETGDRVVLAPADHAMELVLLVDPEAPERPHPSVGLYHMAFLVPDRRSLAQVLRGLQSEAVVLDGAADHGVSEALYLTDPEGNGIEIYRDRDRDRWPREGDEIAMVTRRLDLEDPLAEATTPSRLPAATRLGHVHLHVPDLEEGGRFYRSLGLRVTQSTYPGALFLAAGGYHHHVGLNTWAGHRTAPEGATGLVGYTWEVPPATLEALAGTSVDGLGVRDDRIEAVDPAGIRVGFESP